MKTNPAFTFVEVSLALAIASFALVAVLGALPAGLEAVRDVQSQEIAANIARRLQADLLPISFADPTGGTTISTIAANSRFYTRDGVETSDPANANPSSNAFYKVVFTVANPVFNDGTAQSVAPQAFQASNARKRYRNFVLSAVRNRCRKTEVRLFLSCGEAGNELKRRQNFIPVTRISDCRASQMNANAFTLLELVVSTVVVLILLGLVLTITGSVGTAISQASSHLDAFAEARAAFDL